MKLFEEFKLYENMWDEQETASKALTESDDPYGYGPYKKFSDPDLKVGDYVLTTRPFSRGGNTYPARITSISSKWIEYEISGFGFTDKGIKARPGSQAANAITKAKNYLGNLKEATTSWEAEAAQANNIIHNLLQAAAVRKGRRVGTGEEELYNWLKNEDYYRVEFIAWKQGVAYSFKDFPQHLKDSSTSVFERYGIECFVGTLPEVTEVLNDVVAKGYEFDFITVSKLLITPPQKKYGYIGIDENTDEVFLLSEFDSWEDDQKVYQAPTIRYNKIFNEHEPFIQAIKNSQGYGIFIEAMMTEAQAAKYEILYSDRHTEIVDEDTMNQLIDELESFTRDDVLQIHRIYSNGKLGKTIWTEEEGLF